MRRWMDSFTRAPDEAVFADLASRFEADLRTVRLVKRRQVGRVFGYAVEFHGLPFPPTYVMRGGSFPKKRAMSAFYAASAAPDHSVSLLSVSASPASVYARTDADECDVALHGSLVPVPFIGGVLPRDASIRFVRLRDAVGGILQDDVDDGYVLFLHDAPLINPLTFSLCDAMENVRNDTVRSF
jgi:hypothetical protein